mgnify:CR=1 FL=1
MMNTKLIIRQCAGVISLLYCTHVLYQVYITCIIKEYKSNYNALKKEEAEYRKLEAYYREELGVEVEGKGIGSDGVDLEVKKEGDGY